MWAGELTAGATHAVDVTDTFDAGVASLKEHRAYIEGLGWEGWDPEEFLDGILRTRRTGARRHPRRDLRGVPARLGLSAPAPRSDVAARGAVAHASLAPREAGADQRRRARRRRGSPTLVHGLGAPSGSGRIATVLRDTATRSWSASIGADLVERREQRVVVRRADLQATRACRPSAAPTTDALLEPAAARSRSTCRSSSERRTASTRLPASSRCGTSWPAPPRRRPPASPPTTTAAQRTPSTATTRVEPVALPPQGTTCSLSRMSVIAMWPGAWPMASAGRDCMTAACGVTPHAQKTGHLAGTHLDRVAEVGGVEVGDAELARGRRRAPGAPWTAG